MFKIVAQRRWFFIASGILALLSIVALVISTLRFGLPVPLSDDPSSAQAARIAGLAALVVLVMAPLVVWGVFRDAAKAAQYALCTLVILLHNLLVTCGFYALMALVAGWEVDGLALVSTLAVLIFSTYGVFAIFNRLAVNVSARTMEPKTVTASRAVLDVINHSLTARLCAAFVLVAVTISSGPTIRPLAATVLVGLVAETYASLFIAAPLLGAWQGSH